MHNLGTVSASRLTSAPRLEYTKIHGLSICPYQNQSHFNRILKSYPLPPPKVPVSRLYRAPPHIPVPAHLPLVFYALFPAHTYARALFANSPAPASTLSPPASRLLLRSHRDTPREKVLQIAPAPACTPHIPAPAHLPTAFIPLHSPAPASARTPHIPAPAHPPPVFHIPPPARLRVRAPSAGFATAPPLPPRYSPRKSAPNRPAPACTPHIPAPAHLPTAFIPLHSPAPASARTPHIPAPAHPPPVFHIPPPARLRARAPSAGSAILPAKKCSKSLARAAVMV